VLTNAASLLVSFGNDNQHYKKKAVAHLQARKKAPWTLQEASLV
jgi:hypothetical protein